MGQHYSEHIVVIVLDNALGNNFSMHPCIDLICSTLIMLVVLDGKRVRFDENF